MEYFAAKAALEWQIELGADEAIGEAPVDRYALPVDAPGKAKSKPGAKPVGAAVPIVQAVEIDAVAVARQAAEAAGDLDALKAAMAAFEHCRRDVGGHRHGPRTRGCTGLYHQRSAVASAAKSRPQGGRDCHDVAVS